MMANVAMSSTRIPCTGLFKWFGMSGLKMRSLIWPYNLRFLFMYTCKRQVQSLCIAISMALSCSEHPVWGRQFKLTAFNQQIYCISQLPRFLITAAFKSLGRPGDEATAVGCATNPVNGQCAPVALVVLLLEVYCLCRYLLARHPIKKVSVQSRCIDSPGATPECWEGQWDCSLRMTLIIKETAVAYQLTRLVLWKPQKLHCYKPQMKYCGCWNCVLCMAFLYPQDCQYILTIRYLFFTGWRARLCACWE